MRGPLPRLLWVLLAAAGCAGDAEPAICPAKAPADEVGRCVKRCATQTDCRVDQVCANGSCQAPPSGDPVVLLFDAQPRTVQPGGRVRVRYSVANATRVQVAISDGTGNARPLVDSTTERVGYADTDPLTEDVTLTLLVFDAQQAPITRNIDIDVVEDETLRITSFVAEPDVVRSGQQTRLTWTTVNAVGAVRIIAEETGAVVLSSGPVNGFHDTPVEASTTYVLRVDGVDERLEARAPVEVIREGDLAIRRFTVLPGGVGRGDTAVASWQTTGASRVILRLTGPNGPVVYDSRAPAYVAEGAFVVAPSPLGRTFFLQAFSSAGDVVSKVGTVQLGDAPPPAEIAGFEVDPELFPAGVDEKGLSFAWDAGPSDAALLLTVDGQPFEVTGLPGFAGTFRAGRTLLATLEAFAPGGRARATARVWNVIPEVEPNDLMLDAMGPQGSAVAGALVGASADVDRFEVEVPALGGLRTSFLLGTDRCTREVQLELWRDQRRLKAAFGTALGACPRLDEAALAGGRYQVVLSAPERSAVLRYVLGVAVEASSCGDGATDLSSEQCDDGNLAAGDGCSPACRLEPAYLYGRQVQPFDAWEPVPDRAEVVSWLPYAEAQPAPPEDEGFAVIPLPSAFPFFGRAYAGVIVHANGYVSFVPDYAGDEIEPRTPWGAARPNALVAAVGADLVWQDAVPPRYWYDDEPSVGQILWIDFSGARFRAADDDVIQARIGLATDGTVLLRYGALQTSRPFVAGIEGPLGNFQYRHPTCGVECTPNTLPRNTVTVFRNTSE